MSSVSLKGLSECYNPEKLGGTTPVHIFPDDSNNTRVFMCTCVFTQILEPSILQNTTQEDTVAVHINILHKAGYTGVTAMSCSAEYAGTHSQKTAFASV